MILLERRLLHFRTALWRCPLPAVQPNCHGNCFLTLRSEVLKQAASQLQQRPSGERRTEVEMREQRTVIQKRAYEIWQAEGQPSDRHLAHWLRAEEEVSRPQPATMKRRRSTAAAPRRKS